MTETFFEAPSGWPPSLSEIAVILGRETTLRLVGAMRSQKRTTRAWACEFYVPYRVPDEHPIAEAIGARAARRLSEYFGGVIMKVSGGGAIERQARRDAIRRLRGAGLTVAQIAERTDLSDRYVREVLAAETPEGHG